MAKMTVHMLGIMYFDICDTEEPMVVLPDGTEGDDMMPPHYASLFIERARFDYDHNWPGECHVREIPLLTIRSEQITIPILEYRLDPLTQITFPHDVCGYFDAGDVPRALPQLTEADPGFLLDPDGAVALSALRSGRLGAYRFTAGTHAVQWTIKTGNAPLKIIATRNGQTGSLVLKPQPDNPHGAEVVFGNMPDFLETLVPGSNIKHHEHGVTNPHPTHHFALYSKIDLNHGTVRFPSRYADIPYRSSIMAALADASTDSSCGPTCCGSGTG